MAKWGTYPPDEQLRLKRAAAEELYEALADVLPYLEEGYLDDEEDDEPVAWTSDSEGKNQRPVALTFGMVRRARSAIDKARGQA